MNRFLAALAGLVLIACAPVAQAATVHAALLNVQARALTGSTMPVADSVPIDAETVTSSGTSASVGLTGQLGQFWSFTVTGGAVYLRCGASPTAVTDEGWLILDGQTREFAVTAANELCAIKDL